MKNIKLEVMDKKIVFSHHSEIVGNIFTCIYEIKLDKTKLNTFWKRIKWLLTGKV